MRSITMKLIRPDVQKITDNPQSTQKQNEYNVEDVELAVAEYGWTGSNGMTGRTKFVG